MLTFHISCDMIWYISVKNTRLYPKDIVSLIEGCFLQNCHIKTIIIFWVSIFLRHALANLNFIKIVNFITDFICIISVHFHMMKLVMTTRSMMFFSVFFNFIYASFFTIALVAFINFTCEQMYFNVFMILTLIIAESILKRRNLFWLLYTSLMVCT